MWHFRNDEQSFVTDRFRPKSAFNPRNEEVIIQTYLSCLQEGWLGIKIASKKFINLTMEEQEALYSLQNDPSIIVKYVDTGSVVFVWDKEDNLKTKYRQLDDREVYHQDPNDLSVLINTMETQCKKECQLRFFYCNYP